MAMMTMTTVVVAAAVVVAMVWFWLARHRLFDTPLTWKLNECGGERVRSFARWLCAHFRLLDEFVYAARIQPVRCKRCCA